MSAALTQAGDLTAAALTLAPGELVAEIVRIRLADGVPLSLERARFPAARFPGLLDLPLGGSVYELLEVRYGIRPAEAIERIDAIACGEEEAAILDIPAGTPALAITRTALDEKGRPFEYSRDLFRADRTRIVVRIPGAVGTAESARGNGRLIDLS